ncbi:sugar phosphate nucleotidyltransferase [Aerococcus urinaeequi]|uniref:sugar phosphate nucleotidyltransferase n=1 Tax=Aerococcus urinaeequi TaxID=51665 RepID=UPI003D6C1B0F
MKFALVNDGTLTNETRLVAIGDIQFMIDQLGIHDDLLILTVNNLFEFSLAEFVDFAKKSYSDALAMYCEANLDQLKRNGTVDFDENRTVRDFIEKPDIPTFHHCVPNFYLLKESTLPLINEYLNEGSNPDAPGNFITYLIQYSEVKAIMFKGKRYDIGTVDSYGNVQQIFSDK